METADIIAEQGSTQVLNAPEQKRIGLGKRVRGSLWLLVPLCVLIVARALLIHNDPTDFPLDRNISAAGRIKLFIEKVGNHPFSQRSREWFIRAPKEAPEVQFLPAGAWLISRLRVEPIISGRLVSLAAAILTGLGIYLLGRRLGSPLTGALALLVYALNPLAVQMGRGLLPDTIMTAALVWAIVAAGPGRKQNFGRNWRAPVGMTLLLIIAALAKLPALFFAPEAAVALMQNLGWRRGSAWLSLFGSALVTWLVVCVWYDFSFFWPFPGLARMSAETNNLMTFSLANLYGAEPLRICMMRVVLALSIPGLALALTGWVLLQGRAGQRLLLNLWFIAGILFIIITLGANTYWAYPLIPAGALLAGLAIAESLRFNRWALVTLCAIVFAGYWLCPSVARVREYLLPHPEYRAMGEAGRRSIRNGGVLYSGISPGDIDYFVGHGGVSEPKLSESTLKQLRGGEFNYFLTNQMEGSGIIFDLFNQKPVIETRPGDFILYHAARHASLGPPVKAVELSSPTLQLSFKNIISIIKVQASSTRVKAGDELGLDVVYERGTEYQEPPNMAVEFVHQPTALFLPVPPRSYGAILKGWSMPFLQLPDLTSATLARMHYDFSLPRWMPAGAYHVRFSEMINKVGGDVNSQPQQAENVFVVEGAPEPAGLPLTIDPAECLWLQADWQREVPWLGKIRRTPVLSGNARLWLSPRLPRGTYQMRVTSEAEPAWVSPTDIWPILSVKEAAKYRKVVIPFSSQSQETVKINIDWLGPQDCLTLELENPATSAVPYVPFPLYLGANYSETRGIRIEKIEFYPAK